MKNTVISKRRNKMLNEVIKKYGFEAKQTLVFARLCETCKNEHIVKAMYNKYITN